MAEAQRLPIHLAEVDVGQLIQETVATFDFAAKEQDVQLSAQIEPSLQLHADSNRLRQVLHNLLANALRHTSAEGFVRVIAKRVENQIEVSIHDSGVGIDSADLAIIFNRFERASTAKRRDRGGSSGGSTGLGLAITKAIVELHSGSIAGQSEGLGKGSVFTITFPI